MDFHESVTNTSLKWLAENQDLKTYYHYTNEKSYKAIKAGNKIFAFNIQHLQRNDKDEFLNGYNLFLKIAKERGLEIYFKRFDIFFKKEERFQNMKLYILSTTKDSKSPDHVREYGKGNIDNVVAISSIDLIEKNNFKSPYFFYSLDVIYNDEKKLELYKKFFDVFEKHFNYLVDTMGEKYSNSKEFKDLYLAVLQVVVIYCSIFKNKKYDWENEHRFVVFRGIYEKKYKTYIPLNIF
jgi:hypothetical protein